MRKRLYKSITLFFVLGLMSIPTTAQNRVKAYRVSDQTVQRLLTRIETSTDNFKRNMNAALDQSRYNGTKTEDNVLDYITEFENATDRLKQRFDAKESVNADVTNVLNRASGINSFMRANRLSTRAQRNWTRVKTDLDTLAGYYGVRYDWNVAVMSGSKVYVKPYRVSDDSVKSILSRIESKTDNYKILIDRALDRSTLNGSDSEDRILAYIKSFENDTDQLKKRFEDKKSVIADVENVLNRAASIEAFMKRNDLTNQSEREWDTIRYDLDILASYYNVTTDWTKSPIDSDVVAYTVAGTRVGNLLSQIESKTDVFKRQMNTALDRSVLNGSRSEDAIFAYITSFENSTDRLKQRFDANESVDSDVTMVLNKAGVIDNFMRDYRLLRSAENQWISIRADLNSLSNYYAVAWKWDRQYDPVTKFDSMLTGTYELNTMLSDDVDKVVENSIRIYPQSREDRIERSLKTRLMAPEKLLIQKDNEKVMIASSNAPQISFMADGVARRETNRNGKLITVTASSTYDGVAVKYEGDRIRDFYVNFMPMDDGSLRVVRRVYLANMDETVTVASVYDRVKTNPAWNSDIATTGSGTLINEFVVADGTKVTAELMNEVSTKTSQDGDRFRMEVTGPAEFDGAIIEGRVIKPKRSGRLAGNAQLTLDFDTIRLEDGRTFKFAGIVEMVKASNGEKVILNNEGQVKDNNQTSKTIKRAGIGAGLGAILGAILGGGDGALIGAAVGAGAGTGTVIAQGKDDVELGQGSSFTIAASAPVATVNAN